MNVKNGIASSVSFDMMPHSRSGSAPNREGESRPSSIPMSPNTMPFAASAKATG